MALLLIIESVKADSWMNEMSKYESLPENKFLDTSFDMVCNGLMPSRQDRIVLQILTEAAEDTTCLTVRMMNQMVIPSIPGLPVALRLLMTAQKQCWYMHKTRQQVSTSVLLHAPENLPLFILESGLQPFLRLKCITISELSLSTPVVPWILDKFSYHVYTLI